MKRPAGFYGEMARGGSYVVGVLAAFPVARAIEYFWPAGRWFGESAAYVAGFIVLGISLVLWIPYRAQLRWAGLTHAFFALTLVLWALVGLLSVRRGDTVDAAILALPVAVVLLWVKRPSPEMVRVAVDVLAWAITALMIGVLILQLIGVLDKADAGSALPYDRENYWLPLSGVLGIDGRWIGPMRWPNVTAAAAVLLVIYGATRGWRERVGFIGTGVLVLVLTGTRTSMVASVVGLAVLMVCSRRKTLAGMPKRFVVSGIVVVGIAYVVTWLVRNPTLTGRTEMWPTYFDLWRSSPWIGVGDAGVGLAQQGGRLPGWATTAESIYFDPLARYGAVAFVLVVGVLTISTVLAWRAARAGDAVALALVVALLVGGISETLLDWRYLLVFQLQAVIVAMLLATRTNGGAAFRDEPQEASPTKEHPA